MSGNDTTKPALRSAEEIGRLALLIRGSIHGGAVAAGEDALAALLGHIDALSAGVDAEAGRRLFYELNPHAHKRAWEAHDPDVRERYDNAAATLFTLGRAAGRSEGEAKRSQLRTHLDLATDKADNMVGAIDEARAEIARLTAELAAERQKHGEDLLATMRSHDAALVAARAEGARVEREGAQPVLDALTKLEHWAERFETEPQGVGLDAVERRLAAVRAEAAYVLKAEAERRARGERGRVMASIDEDIIAALRARVAGLERRAELLRDSRARVCGTLASIHAALDGRPASEGEPDVVRRAARVVAELAAERALRSSAETAGLRLAAEHRETWARARAAHAEALAATRREGAREEREAIEAWLRTEMNNAGQAGLAQEERALYDALDWLRARGEGSPT